MAEEFRTESDSMGEVSIPKRAYWGAQTERARQNFRIGKELMPLGLIRALAIQKRCAAQTNLSLKTLASNIAEAIIQAADEVIEGEVGRPLSPCDMANGVGYPNQHEYE
jgi:fumarate hydratase class II